MATIEKKPDPQGERLRRFLIARFGKVSTAAAALGIKAATFYPYFRGEKEPGGPFLKRLASVGANLHWLLTGDGEMMINSDPSTDLGSAEQVPTGSSIDSSDSSVDDRVTLLDAMGIDSAEKLRRFFDPEAFVADLLASYLANLRSRHGK